MSYSIRFNVNLMFVMLIILFCFIFSVRCLLHLFEPWLMMSSSMYTLQASNNPIDWKLITNNSRNNKNNYKNNYNKMLYNNNNENFHHYYYHYFYYYDYKYKSNINNKNNNHFTLERTTSNSNISKSSVSIISLNRQLEKIPNKNERPIWEQQPPQQQLEQNIPQSMKIFHTNSETMINSNLKSTATTKATQSTTTTTIISTTIYNNENTTTNNDDNNNDNNNNNNNSTNLNNTNKNNNNNKKIIAILHIGPRKTGTTAIQHSIRTYESILLKEDDYFRGMNYLPVSPKSNSTTSHIVESFLDCFKFPKRTTTTTTTNQSTVSWCNTTRDSPYRMIQQIGRKERKHLLFSHEFLSDPSINPQLLYDYLFQEMNWNDTNDWNSSSSSNSSGSNNPRKTTTTTTTTTTIIKPYDDAIIVLFYRRFMDWFISLHYQGSVVLPIPKRRTIVQHLQDEMKNHHDIEHKYTFGVYKRYRTVFQQQHQIKILNLHHHDHHHHQYYNDSHYSHSVNDTMNSTNETETEVEHDDSRIPFFCDGIPDANFTCNTILKEEEEVGTKVTSGTNVHYPLVYDEITYYAREYGWWFDKESQMFQQQQQFETNILYYTFEYVTYQVKNYQEIILNRTEYNFQNQYKICPTLEQYQWIYNTSNQMEYELVPDYHNTSIAKQGMVQSYTKIIQRGSLCHIDAKRIVQNGCNSSSNSCTNTTNTNTTGHDDDDEYDDDSTIWYNFFHNILK